MSEKQQAHILYFVDEKKSDSNAIGTHLLCLAHIKFSFCVEIQWKCAASERVKYSLRILA